MARQFNVAVLGASGVVGKQMIEVLEERNFPIGSLFPLASHRSVEQGKTVTFRGEDIPVIDVDTFDWTSAELAFFSAGGSVSAKYAPIAGDAGCVVIDNTSHFRNEPDIPLIVPEVNPEALANFRDRNIIANPNCSTIQMVVALKPIYDAVGISRINVSTYQSVSGAGGSAIDELVQQTAHLMNGREFEPKQFTKQIAFNAIPQIDTFQDNGYTREEMKMVWETKKIMGDENILVNPTAVRVPVIYGHGEALHIETNQPVDAATAKELLRNADGVTVVEDDQDYPTQVTDASGKDDVFVGRIRNDISHENGLNMWIVADNIRKGAATNSVQIGELLIRDYL